MKTHNENTQNCQLEFRFSGVHKYGSGLKAGGAGGIWWGFTRGGARACATEVDPSGRGLTLVGDVFHRTGAARWGRFPRVTRLLREYP